MWGRTNWTHRAASGPRKDEGVKDVRKSVGVPVFCMHFTAPPTVLRKIHISGCSPTRGQSFKSDHFVQQQ